MKENELKALVSLLDDEDTQIITHVEEKILSVGNRYDSLPGTGVGKQFQPAGTTSYRRPYSYASI